MDKLPLNDIPMLVSSINFLLRDHIFDNLAGICEEYGYGLKEITDLLASSGYEYSEEHNKVW